MHPSVSTSSYGRTETSLSHSGFCRGVVVEKFPFDVVHRWLIDSRRWIAAARAKLVAVGVLSPWGISSRLLIAFFGVAVLATAANFIVERSALMIPPSVVTPTVRVAPAPVTEVQAPAPAPTPAPFIEPTPLSADELTRALERFDQSVYAAVDSNSIELLARYRQAEKDLDRGTINFLTRADQLDARSATALRAAMKDHKQAAALWIDLSQSRRNGLREYSETLQRMNTRVNTSLDAAFKIFGRVVARQSLVELNTDLAAMRENFSATIRRTAGAGSFDAMHRAELAFASVLDRNAKGLKRAEGDEWFSAMEQDLRTLTQLRESVASQQLENTGSTFVTGANSLAALLPKLAAAHSTKARAIAVEAQRAEAADSAPTITAPTTNSTANPSSGEAATPDTTAAANPAASPLAENVAPVVNTGNVTAEAPSELGASKRVIMAWLSIAVLLMLLLISLATVRSVVQPVRRLINASRRIAAGEPDARVPRGGIKELDALAVAFNDMADRLAQAQALALDAHHQLEEKVAERTRQLQELAEIDSLTALPNRRHLFTLLNASLQQAAREQRRIGVLFLDVDNFKNINDSAGHSFGDRVLREIAQRLETTSRSIGYAARLGGDEFTIVCDQANSLDDIREAGEQIIRAFQSPLTVDGRELIIGVSVGASVYPDHEDTAEALLIAADTALFNAKALGRSRLSMFAPELLAGVSTKFRIEQELRRALERGEFELFFQPELAIDDLQTHLVEALIRWRKPDGSYVPPGEFLAVAEESGLILEISDWVLRSAIQTAAQWHRGAWPEARIAINVSPRQLLDYRFVDRVHELLDEYDVPPRCIEIELTESVLQTGPATIEQLHRLRALGLAIALDDFGTGYSSLSSLEHLPLTRVKLDRSLIESIDSNERSRSIVRAIIHLCHGLGLQVTAEGLERAEQFEQFLGQQQLALQGYLLSRPVPANQLFAARETAAQRAQELVLLARPKSVPALTVVPKSPLTERLIGA